MLRKVRKKISFLLTLALLLGCFSFPAIALDEEALETEDGYSISMSMLGEVRH